MDNIEIERQKQLEECVQDIWEYEKYLYVGANKNRFHFKRMLRGKNVDVVEIDKERCEELRRDDWNVLDIDIADYTDRAGFLPLYEVAIWSHGPSCMVSYLQAIKAINNLKRFADIVVLMCPWGRYEAKAGNLYDTNWLALYPDFFQDLGFDTSCLGGPDVNGSNLLSWWRRDLER